MNIRSAPFSSPKLSVYLTIGSSDRGGNISDEPWSESMIEIKQLRSMSAQTRVAQPHR
jgi:hypothetical protein